MLRIATGLIGMAMIFALPGCERKEPTGGGETTSTQPAGRPTPTTQPGGRPAAVPTSQEADALEQLKELGNRLRQKSVEEARRGLARLDERVQDLRQKLQTAEEQARPAIQKQLDDLSVRAARAHETLDKLAGVSGNAWDELRKGVDAALGEFKEAVSSQPATQPASAPSPANTQTR